MYMEVKKFCKLNATDTSGIYGGSSHPEGNKLVEHIEDVWIEVLREEQRLQRRAVPLNLLREDMSFLGSQLMTTVGIYWICSGKPKCHLIVLQQGHPRFPNICWT